MTKTNDPPAEQSVAVIKENEYLALQGSPDNLALVMATNLAGSEVSEFDLDRVGLPGAGGLAWTVPDINGEPVARTELRGVILLHGNRRAYWEESFEDSGGGSPPDCLSNDGVHGSGRIAGDEKKRAGIDRQCRQCPMSQWGSASSGEGQACQQRKLLFFLRPGDTLPLVIDLAPTSLRPLSRFMLRLTSRGISCHGAEVALGLKSTQSKGGITYSVISPRLVATFPHDETERLAKMAAAFRPFFEKSEAWKPEAEAKPEARGWEDGIIE